MNLKAIGKRIKQAREAKGLTQALLAEKVNLSTSHMSAIERGVKQPKLDTFIEILNVLQVDANSILTDVLAVSNEIVSSQLSIKMSELPKDQQRKTLRVLETLIRETSDD
ncbi:MAG: helix-turn-helix domain-containing protein [Anaerovoracaceae bacterium]|jgi:transcriptional regulator with XRE-family HTH domain